MKKYEELPSCVRERKCANPECNEVFSPKNDKAIHCCPRCKNRAGLLRRNEKYGEEYKWFKMFIYNCKVLEALFNMGKRIVTDEVLESYRFFMKIGPLLEVIKGKGIIIPYGKYALCCNDTTTYRIEKIR